MSNSMKSSNTDIFSVIIKTCELHIYFYLYIYKSRIFKRPQLKTMTVAFTVDSSSQFTIYFKCFLE